MIVPNEPSKKVKVSQIIITIVISVFVGVVIINAMLQPQTGMIPYQPDWVQVVTPFLIAIFICTAIIVIYILCGEKEMPSETNLPVTIEKAKDTSIKNYSLVYDMHDGRPTIIEVHAKNNTPVTTQLTEPKRND